MSHRLHTSSFFFFNDTATTEIYTLSLHDALPICSHLSWSLRALERDHEAVRARHHVLYVEAQISGAAADRKSTRLNSSHLVISYAVFCLKKKKKPFTMSRYASEPSDSPR